MRVPQVIRARSLTAAAFIVIIGSSVAGTSGCNFTEESAPEQRVELASDEQLARKPEILRSPQIADAELPSLLERVPSEVRRPIEQIREIPNPTSSRRYWLTPWPGPKGDFGFSCLYAYSPSEAGPSTSCFSDQDLLDGRGVSYAVIDGKFEFVGFNPDPRGGVTLRFGSRVVPIPIRDGVYVGSKDKLPNSIRVISGGRPIVHRIPQDLR